MDGSGEDDFPPEKFSDLYDELFNAGIFDGSVSVINDDNGWSISAHRDRRVVYEHLGGEGTPRHMIPVCKEKVIQLWNELLTWNIEALESEPWQNGYT
jgi:hypothetical protein